MSRDFAAVRDSARSHLFTHPFCAPLAAAAELSAGGIPLLCAAALAGWKYDGTRSEGDKPAREHLRACCLVDSSACLCDRDKRILAVAHESCWALGPSPWLQTACRSSSQRCSAAALERRTPQANTYHVIMHRSCISARCLASGRLVAAR